MGDLPDPAAAVVYYVVFLFSTTLHEAAHAWTAKLGGDLTAYHGGQVTLDPRPHIRREPVGMVVLPLITVMVSGWPFGYASAPYDPQWAMRYPRRAAWMALAGPGANLLIVALALGLIRWGAGAGVFVAPDSVRFGEIVAAAQPGVWDGVAFVVGVFLSLNLLLAALNLLPLPPLDGSAALTLLLPQSMVPRYQQMLWRTPGLAVLGIVVAWQLIDVVFRPVFLLFVNLLYPGVSYR